MKQAVIGTKAGNFRASVSSLWLMDNTRKNPFWEAKSLTEMSPEEWESVCDGCGKCCVVLFDDDETDEVWETDVACKLFDCKTRRCRDYNNRHAIVPGCISLTPGNVSTLHWMPESCAYKRLAAGQGLADWHPLVSGRRDSVVEAGIAVENDMPSEDNVSDEDQEERIIGRRWPPP